MNLIDSFSRTFSQTAKSELIHFLENYFASKADAIKGLVFGKNNTGNFLQVTTNDQNGDGYGVEVTDAGGILVTTSASDGMTLSTTGVGGLALRSTSAGISAQVGLSSANRGTLGIATTGGSLLYNDHTHTTTGGFTITATNLTCAPNNAGNTYFYMGTYGAMTKGIIMHNDAAASIELDDSGNISLFTNGKTIEMTADKHGFYGATPVVQAAHPTVLADVITLLTNLGLCA